MWCGEGSRYFEGTERPRLSFVPTTSIGPCAVVKMTGTSVHVGSNPTSPTIYGGAALTWSSHSRCRVGNTQSSDVPSTF